MKVLGLFAICERFGISETAASNVINLENEKNKVDQKSNQSQLNKLKKKLRLKKVENFTQEHVIAIGFDERVDHTKVAVGVGIKGHKRFELRKEEHCVVITYPG